MKILTLMFAALLLVSQAQAEESVVPLPAPAFGDWTKKCEKTADGTEICYIMQDVLHEGKKAMRMRIAVAPENGKVLMSVGVPLGVVLPTGAAYFMDDQEQLKMKFIFCDPGGCHSGGTIMTDALIEKMQKGTKGDVRVVTMNKKLVQMTISLKGFTRALNSIRTKK